MSLLGFFFLLGFFSYYGFFSMVGFFGKKYFLSRKKNFANKKNFLFLILKVLLLFYEKTQQFSFWDKKIFSLQKIHFAEKIPL